MTRAGIATIAGKPNAGKSTLLNRIVGQKLGITSPKPQSTRGKVIGIHTSADTQIVLVDTPGLLDPRYALQEAMAQTARNALNDADAILYLVDPAEGVVTPVADAAGLAQPPRAPVLLCVNKSDLLATEERTAIKQIHPEAFFISARTGAGVPELVEAIESHMPDSPFLYPEDDVSTQTVRFFVAELIRESALEQLDEEVPYSLACEVEEFREGSEPVYIRAGLYVERAGQKAILIGARGSRIREIGRLARMKIEELIGNRVYLDLWVKVLPNWRRDTALLRRFGYHVNEDELR